ncbi:MAG: PQQ-dependent sugar dehydrogenase [Acidobacteriota bacterium]|jgi:glucose/arabinose dehydrogenase
MKPHSAPYEIVLFLGAVVASMTVAACAAGDGETPDEIAFTPASFACEQDIGITLPDGFCGVVFADNLGRARHIAVNDNGDVYVATQAPRRRRGEDAPPPPPPIRALRDSDGDGKADVEEDFGDQPGGTGMGIHGGFLYFSTPTAVYRYALGGGLVPAGEAEPVIEGFAEQGQHYSKPFSFDEAGHIYVTVGAPSNACQEEARTPGSPGVNPCPQLDEHAGIWRFDAAASGQTPADGERYATGIRNAMALDWNHETDRLYALQHGRDSLATLWPDDYDDAISAELPAEEMMIVEEGADFGWPYCYWDQLQDKRVLAPEYGGDGAEVGRCAEFGEPIVAFPGHWAPNDLVFYEGEQFPARYRGGAFVAFHGSWNRSPLPQEGYRVSFVPMRDGMPAGEYETFADGFAGPPPIEMGNVTARPTGLAVGPDGSLFIVDGQRGKVWRIVYAPSSEAER